MSSTHPNVSSRHESGLCKSETKPSRESGSVICNESILFGLEQIIWSGTVINGARSEERWKIEMANSKYIKTIMLHLAHAVHHIHCNDRFHGSIAPENVHLTIDKSEIILVQSSGGMVHSGSGGCQRFVDIQALRELFTFSLTNGKKQDSMITDDLVTAEDLLHTMSMPVTTTRDILKHPFFWSAEKKLGFLSKISQMLKAEPYSDLKSQLNEESGNVFSTSGGWKRKLVIDSQSQEMSDYNAAFKKRKGNEKKERKIRTTVIQQMAQNTVEHQAYSEPNLSSLLRFIRNVHAHFWEDNLQSQACYLYDHTDGYLKFFLHRFPSLFCVVYNVMKKYPRTVKGFTDVYFDQITEKQSLLE